MEQADFEKLIGELEVAVDRLRALYDQYFVGLEKIEPGVVRKDVDRRIYVLRKEQIRNTALRFRFQMVLQRYSTYQTHWQRICREIENGTYKRHLVRAQRRFGSTQPPSRSRGPSPSIPPAANVPRESSAGAQPDSDLGQDLGIDIEVMEEQPAAGGVPTPATSAVPAAPQAAPRAPQAALNVGPSAAPRPALNRPAPPAPTPKGAPAGSSAKPGDASLATAAPQPAGSSRPVGPPRPGPAAPAAPNPARPVAAGSGPAPVAASNPPAPVAAARAPAPVTAPTPTVAIAPKPTAAAPTAAAELPEQRLRELYAEYLGAKRRQNESTVAITYQAVAQSLRESGDRLRKKHGRSVDFEVVIKDGKAFLRPVVK